MRKFSVKVNGVAYDVEIEELDATVSSAPVVTSAPVAPAAAPAAPADNDAAAQNGPAVDPEK